MIYATSIILKMALAKTRNISWTNRTRTCCFPIPFFKALSETRSVFAGKRYICNAKYSPAFC